MTRMFQLSLSASRASSLSHMHRHGMLRNATCGRDTPHIHGSSKIAPIIANYFLSSHTWERVHMVLLTCYWKTKTPLVSTNGNAFSHRSPGVRNREICNKMPLKLILHHFFKNTSHFQKENSCRLIFGSF